MKPSIKWISFFLAILIVSCKKFVQVAPPVTSITGEVVYQNDVSAAAAMTAVYEQMIQYNGNTTGAYLIGTSFIGGLVADELENYSSISALSQAYTNTLTSSTNYFWDNIYGEAYKANAVLTGLSNSQSVSTAEKQQLMGEALFIRAFLHFYATNFFGDVPLVTTTNYATNNTISRTPSAQVYQQIIQDLTQAETLLPVNFVNPTGGTTTTERVRPTRWAAAALLARVYLYTGAWDSAKAQATQVINKTSLFSLVTTLNNVFKKNSNEAIWQLQPVLTGYNTFDAYNFVLTSAPGSSQFPVALSTNVLNAFETGDSRRTSWVGSFTSSGTTYYYPFKYQAATNSSNTAAVVEYYMVLRLAEQYLIRAEAEAQLGDPTDAATDLNIIRNRAGLANISDSIASSQSYLLSAILHERQVELFTEWGHRWFDLKRLNLVNSVMGSPGNVCQSKGGSWNSDWVLFPIPVTELTNNPNLTQNLGY